MDRRELGKTGEKLSMVGFGGIVVRDESPADAASIVAKAIDRGLIILISRPHMAMLKNVWVRR